jgi:hypothetical protein
MKEKINIPENRIEFPRQTSEWRRRSRSRHDYSDRRSSPRYISNFPVNMYVREGKIQRIYPVIAQDISNGGILLEYGDMPYTKTTVLIDFP